MDPTAFYLLVALIGVALLFDFLNGLHDAANSIATIVSTRVLKPQYAVAWAAFFNFIAFLFFGLHVAKTVGTGIITPDIVDDRVIFGALMGAIVWNVVTWIGGIPSSSSHALIGGLLGAGIAKGGFSAVVTSGVTKTAFAIFLSPAVGFSIALLLVLIVSWICYRMSPFAVDGAFRWLQFVSASLYSLGHGGNDAQKTMGIIAVLLFSHGMLGGEFHVPFWVVITCQAAMGPRNAVRGLANRAHNGFENHAPDADAGILCGDRRRDHVVHGDRSRRARLDDAYDHRFDHRRGCGAARFGSPLGRGARNRVRMDRDDARSRPHRCIVLRTDEALLTMAGKGKKGEGQGKGGLETNEPKQQIAALPYRRRKTLEVMLVSTLESRRWVIPKGWPMKGHTDSEAAAREAFEEAGLLGEISEVPFGQFHYFKRKKNGAVWLCRVDVFPMQVSEQRRSWPEKAQRKTKWFSLEKAAMEVGDPELGELLLTWAAAAA